MRGEDRDVWIDHCKHLDLFARVRFLPWAEVQQPFQRTPVLPNALTKVRHEACVASDNEGEGFVALWLSRSLVNRGAHIWVEGDKELAGRIFIDRARHAVGRGAW